MATVSTFFIAIDARKEIQPIILKGSTRRDLLIALFT